MNDGLVVDLFAGGGGASTGIEWALGRPVDIAINHDPEALAMHAANHPYTLHLCSNVWEVQPRAATDGRPVFMVWASPDCKHFSRAKGGKPLERGIRALAWVVVRWAEETRPELICIENVPEFQGWGPLRRDGRPVQSQVGSTFRAWVRRLKRLGYTVEWRPLVAADYGAPTTRRRLFVVARLGEPVSWPEPTHGKGTPQPWRTAAECINWNDPAPSIFDRKKPLASKTQQRVARGMKRFVLEAARPFIVNLTHGGRLENIDAPVRTVTAAHRGEKALVTLVAEAPFLTEHANHSRPRVFAADEPLRTQVAQVKGGHFALVSAWIAKHYGGVTGQTADKPLGAVTAVDHHSMVSAAILKMRGTNTASKADEPLHTVSAQGQHHGLLCAHISRYYSLGGQLSAADAPLPTATSKARFGLSTACLLQYNGCSEAQPLEEAMPTVTSRDRLGLVDAALGQDGGRYELVCEFLRSWGVIGPDQEAEVEIQGVGRCRIVDIGMRMLRPRELYRAQGFPDTYCIAPDYKGKPLTLTAQVRMCGNSVPPQFSEALVLANMAGVQGGQDLAEAV